MAFEIGILFYMCSTHQSYVGYTNKCKKKKKKKKKIRNLLYGLVIEYYVIF